MIKKYSLVLIALLCSFIGFGQTTIWTEDFSTGTYVITLGGEGNNGTSDYFQTTDGSNIAPSYSGITGNFFAGQDIDDGGWTGSAIPSQITWSGINISSYSSLEFSGDFASVATSKIDDNDYALIEYRVDGGSWTNLLAFENDGTAFNTRFGEDTDFNGDSDGSNLTNFFSAFNKAISGSGSNLDIRITISVNAGGEDIAIDNIEVLGVASGGGCSITDITINQTMACDNNSTTADSSDDYYTADVIVTYSNPPASGNINLTGTGVGTTSVTITSSPQTIGGVLLAANGSNIQISATFSADTSCTYTETVGGSGVTSCSSIGGSTCMAEGFEDATSSTGPDPSTCWILSGIHYGTASATAHSGDNYLVLNATADYAILPQASSATQVNFWCRTSGTASIFTSVIESSPDNSNWTIQATYNANGSNSGGVTQTWQQKTVSLPIGTQYVRLRMTARTTGNIYYDDVELLCSGLTGPHTVAFNSNDGSGMSNQQSCIATNLNTNTFTQNGCTFLRWNTASDASGIDYADGANYSFTSDIDLYAVWDCGVIPCSDLFISEYIEGSGNNKCLEIYNPTGSSVNLTNYAIGIYANGNSTPSSISLSGTITSGDTFVICNPGANVSLVSLSNVTSGSINFNGDDTVALLKSGSIIDVIGQVGFDPGTEWVGGSASTLNRTLIRKNTVQSGDFNGSDIFDPNAEWDVFPIDYDNELGFHFNDCISSNELQLQLPVSIDVSCGYTYSFSPTVIGNNNDIVLRIQNLGNLPLTISGLSLTTGTNYSLVSPPPPFNIAGNNYQDITIRFNPGALGLFLDTLTILNDDTSEGNCEINLSGLSVSNCSTTTEVITAEDFESSNPYTIWNYTADHTAISGNWDVTSSLLPEISAPQSGTNFWGISDLERIGHLGLNHTLDFDLTDISAYTNVQLSFYYYTINIDPSDSFEYELFYDGVSQGISDISANTDAWTEVLVNIPDTVNSIQLIVYADIDAVNDKAGLDNIELTSTTINTSTWTSGGWDTPPDINSVAILDDDYTTNATNGSFRACNLFIKSGNQLTITDGYYVEVENNAKIEGNLLVQTQGSFVQNNDSSTFTLGVNGSSQMNKKTAPLMDWHDYTYWSSPGTNIAAGSALPMSIRRFYYNSANYLDADGDGIDDDANDWITVNDGDIMTPGLGYIASHTNIGFISNRQYQYNFNGSFNNGVVNPSLAFDNRNPRHWNLLGNPYPSAIDTEKFFVENADTSKLIEGIIYLWSHHSDASRDNIGNDVLNYSVKDYAMINRIDGIAGASTKKPEKYIPSGQSFFVNSLAIGNIVFNNSMRKSGENSNTLFFRNQNSSKKDSNTSPQKFWLNLTTDHGVFNQILVGYIEKATDGYDGLSYDAEPVYTGYGSLYTTIEGESRQLAIQGKALESLTLEERIPIGFNSWIDEPTAYTISLADFEGEFFEENTVYLKDNLLNKTHIISESDYDFTSEYGAFENRFEIVFKDSSTLNVEENSLADSLKIIEQENGNIQFELDSNFEFKTIDIVDLLGRTLYSIKANGKSKILNLENINIGTYIARVTLSNETIITKKAIKQK